MHGDGGSFWCRGSWPFRPRGVPRRRRGATCSSWSTASGPTTSPRDVMPNLTALGKRGVVFNRHHSVYPTVTRVNAVVDFDRRLPRNARADGQHGVFSAGGPGEIPRHRGPQQPAEDRRRPKDAADRADAGRIAAGGGPEDARRQLGVERVGVPQQPHACRAARSCTIEYTLPESLARRHEGASVRRPATARRRARSIDTRSTRS